MLFICHPRTPQSFGEYNADMTIGWRDYFMNNQTKILSASSIQATGTVVAAFGTTPANSGRESQRSANSEW